MKKIICTVTMLILTMLASVTLHAQQTWNSGTTILSSPTGLSTDNDLVDTGALLIVTNGGSLLANQLVVGQTPGNGGTLTLLTNAAITVQSLLATNNTAAASGSFVNLGGTLTTSNLNGIAANIVLPINTYTNTSRWIVNGAWNMNGGTNFVTYVYSNGVPRFTVGANSTISVNPNAVLNLTNSTGTNMDLFVGYNTAGSTLVVNGGTVTSFRQLQIGVVGGSANSVLVTNGGTLLGGSGGGATTLAIGAGTGVSNTLAIIGSASKLINNGLALNVGNTLGGSNNNLTVDAGVVTNVGGFNVGISGNCQGNAAVITNGGQLFSSGASNIGNATNANNNAVLVTGAGSLWSAGGANVTLAAVAGNQSGNNLTVSGGVVTNVNTLSIGSGTGTNNNNNNVVIANGGQLFFTNICTVGYNGASNAVTVSGAGSLLDWNGTGNGSIYIGRTSSGNANTNSIANSLVLSNGAQVVCSTLGIGRLDTAGAACSNNFAIIGGGGANALLNTPTVTIGFSAGATNNYLTLNAGGVISNSTTINIGVANSGGSRLNINGGSIVGKTSGTTTITTASDGQLLIQSGGAILNDNGAAISASAPLLGDPTSPGGGLTKLGSGIVVLTGTNTYTGGTLISAGTLRLGNNVSINGSVLGNITNNATLMIASTSDQTLTNAINGTGQLTKTGASTATLTGANTYSGSTTISLGTLALSGSTTISSSPTITVAGGATLDVSGLTSVFSLGGRTLANSSVGAIIKGTNDCSSGTLSLVYNGTNSCFVLTDGHMTLSASTVFTINNTGPQLTVGNSYKIIATNGTSLVTGSVPSSALTVAGSGAAGTATLSILNSEVYLNVAGSTVQPILGVAQNTPGVLTFSWSDAAFHLQAQTNSLSVGLSNNWADYPGGGTSPVNVTINPSNPTVFYRLLKP